MQAPLVYVNGMPDHIHVLASFRPSMSPAEFVQQLKGSSSHFITHQLDQGFEWQEDYAVLSVSEKDVPRVIEYIKNQKQHHAQKAPWHEFEQRGDKA